MEVGAGTVAVMVDVEVIVLETPNPHHEMRIINFMRKFIGILGVGFRER